MREVAETLQAADLPAHLAHAAAETMRLWDADKDCGDLTPSEVLAHLHVTVTDPATRPR
ncbi:hypothetical protein [Streptomyces sp. WM4235]|uniref:hypothetical protein n=1 Tax=Streptomyces sp. WM4235 TaxID=1415551 RepID=UPI000B12FD01|nr:hypothetical protein [Streptomyces sp. WM4235]